MVSNGRNESNWCVYVKATQTGLIVLVVIVALPIEGVSKQDNASEAKIQNGTSPPQAPTINGAEGNNSASFQPRCESPQTREDAEYCQERTSVEAAKKQAEWAQDQFIASEDAVEAMLEIDRRQGADVKASIAESARVAAAMEINALQAEKTLEVVRENGKMQLRAYVLVTGASIIGVETGAPIAVVSIKNSGQTPDYNVRSWINIWIARHPLTENLESPKPGFATSNFIIAPNGFTEMLIQKEPPVQAWSVPLLGTLEGTIYVYGTINYDDAFGHQRVTKYRYIYGGSEDILPNRLAPDGEGNEAT